jgi:hypothetical protein
MNFIPKELTRFLEDYRKIQRKTLISSLDSSEIVVSGSSSNGIFEVDLTGATITSETSLLIKLSEFFLFFSNGTGKFSITIQTTGSRGTITYDNIYTGCYKNGEFRSNVPVSFLLKISEPSLLCIKIRNEHITDSVFNVGVNVIP